MLSKVKKTRYVPHKDDERSPFKKTKNTTPDEEDSVFHEILKKCGFILKRRDESNELNCDQSMFQKDLKKELKIRELRNMGTDVVKDVIGGLEQHFKLPNVLKWCLLPTKTSLSCESSRGVEQDSLVRMLLNIDALQPQIVNLLCEIFLVVAYDESADRKTNLPILILANLRWLDYIVDTKNMATRMKEMLQASPEHVQGEIISFVPNIVDDQHQPEMAEILLKLYERTPSLTTSILDVLPYLSLSSEKLEDILHDVIKTLNVVTIDNLPVVLKFILSSLTTGCRMVEILQDVRENIKLEKDPNPDSTTFQPSQKSQMNRSQFRKSKKPKIDPKDIGNYKVMTFSTMRTTLLTNKSVSTAILKVINEIEAASVKHFDILILLLIHDINPQKRKTVETIFRNIFRSDVALEEVIVDTIRGHSSVVKDLFESLKKVGSVLFRSNNSALTHYGGLMYESCFLYLGEHLQIEVVLAILAHLGDTPDCRARAIYLLSDMSYKHTSSMAKYTIFLKGSIEFMDMLTLREAKQLIDAIIHLAYSPGGQPNLKEEFYIMMVKYLSHPELKYKRLGVVTAAIILKNSNISKNPNQSESDSILLSSNDSNESFELTGEALKNVENIFDSVKKATAKHPIPMALFMDELANIILKDGLSSQLGNWIKDKLLDEFTDTFVLDCSPDISQIDINGPFAISKTFYIAEDDENKDIAINIASMVFKMASDTSKQSTTQSEIHKICPHIRLLRMLVCRLYKGDLEEINAVLDCAVVFPQECVIDKFSLLPTSQQHMVLSCMFFTVNWFRELINAFVVQKDADIKNKVYQRVRQMLSIQEQLCQLLPLSSNYTPPSATFDFDASPPVALVAKGAVDKSKKRKTPKGKGQKKSKEDIVLGSPNNPGTSKAGGVTQQSQSSQKKGSQNNSSLSILISDLTPFRAYLRELHFDVFNLLCHTLSLDPQPKLGQVSLPEAEFLLTDLNLKLNRMLAPAKRITALSKSPNVRDIGFSHLILLRPVHVVECLTRLIRALCAHLEVISAYFQALVECNDGIEDSLDLIGEKVKPVCAVYTKLFETLAVTFSWPDMGLEQNKSLLRNITRIIAKRLETSGVEEMSDEDLVKTTFKYIINFKDSIVNIQTAVNHILVLEGLVCITNSKRLKSDIVTVIEYYLKKNWWTTGGTREKGSAYVANIQILLKILFTLSDTPIEHIQRFSDEGIKVLIELDGKDAVCDELPTLSKATLLTYYRCLNNHLVSSTRMALKSTNTIEEKLDTWHKAVKCWSQLTMVLKKPSTSTNNFMSSGLKTGNSFLEFFLRTGMTDLDKNFRAIGQEVTALLKNIQASTRFLQHACTHSKVVKDSTLTRYVPPLKKTLESFVFRVKAMMALNHCNEAFWMGNLKNRNLDGEEILSQSQIEENDEDSDSVPDEGNEKSDVELSDIEDNDGGQKNKKAADFSSSF